jgi:hypothetical protein
MCQHIPHNSKSKISMWNVLTPTQWMKNVTIENGRSNRRKNNFFIHLNVWLLMK